MQQAFPVALPHVPNYDLAGVITEVGADVRGWSAGDAVVAFLPPAGPGAAAEYIAVPAEALATAPRTGELAELVARVDAGELRIDVADRRPLSDLAVVHDRLAAGRLAGRTILTP